MAKSRFTTSIQAVGIILSLLIAGSDTFAQEGNLNAINTAVPFLNIAPDSRAGALGDAGVATSPDINSQHWNVAKYAFMEAGGGVSVSYTPWLRNIARDVYLASLSTFYKPTDKQAISASMRYFSHGQITVIDFDGATSTQLTPYELAMDAGYSMLFTNNLSGGIVFRYIRSDFASSQLIGGEDTKPGNSVGADIGLYYQENIKLGNKDGEFAWGIRLSNLGTPMEYKTDAKKIAIPASINIGGRIDLNLNESHSISLLLEFNKLLVPTNPVIENDSLVRGYLEPGSTVFGMIRSFYDAPGISYDDGSYSSGFREEMAEVMISTGIEYWYDEQLAIRAGYFHESAIKGNRKFLTFGIGVKTTMFSFDFAYLLPTNGFSSPLANTVRFTIGFDF